FMWDLTDQKVVFDADAVGVYKDTIVLSSRGAETVLIPLQVEVKAKPVISVDPESWNTTVTLEGASVEANQVFDIQVANQIDAPAVSFKDGSNAAFAWNAAESKVTFSASATGTYNGTLVVTSTSAVDVEVPLQVVVNAPTPVITVNPTEWKPEAIVLANNFATVTSAAFSIAVENQIDPAEAALKDGSHFVWNESESKVTFNATQAGNYKDTLIITATGAEAKKVALEVEVLPTPVISVDPESWNTTVTLEGASVEANQVFAIQVANQIDAPAVSFKDGSDAAFAWNAAESKVTFSAGATGTYNGVLVISSTGAEDVEVSLQVVVNAPAPVISVDPAEWKDAIVLEGGNAAAEQAFDIQVSNSKGGLQAAIQGGENSPFAWDADNSKVSFAANAVGNYKDTLIISATDAESVKVALEITVKEPAPIYNKVTAISKDMSGKYLIVYERSATAGAAFNGTDAANNNVAVAINDNKITQYDLEDYLVTIAKMEGGYSLKSGNKYMAGKSGTGALYLEDEASLNTLAIENGELNIVSQGSYLRFNESASRFRYYSDVSYNNIKPIALYRLYEPTTTLTVSPKSAELKIGESAELSVERDGSDELVWGSADANIASVDEDGVVTAIAEGTVKIFATANNISDTCVVTVIKPVPVITAGDAALAWGNLTIEQASAGQKKETTVSVTEGATLSVELDGAQKDNFLAEIKEGKLEVTFTASEAGNYAATAVLKAEGAVDVPVALSATVKAEIIGDAQNDTIVFDVTGLSYGGDRVQYEEKSFAMPSGAEYTIQAGAGKLDAKYLQMRSSNSNSGLICTKSAGKITSVTIVFNKKTSANNIVNIYASNTAYDSIHSSLYSGGSYVAQIAHADGARQTYIFEEDFEYIGIRSKSGAIYLDSIIISRDEPQIIPTTTLAISPDTAEVEVGEKVTLDIQRDGNDKLVWGSTDESIATVEKGVVTGVAAGTVKIFAKANNISDTCIVIVKDASIIEPKSIAEFIAAGGGKCYLTGVVSNIKTDKDGTYNRFGNFTLTDKSGSIYVYGLLTADGEAQQFKTMGVDEHDTLTVLAQEYKLYNEVDEVVNAVFVSVSKFHQDTANVDFTEAQAIYYGENEGIHNFGLQMFSFAEWDENGESVGDGVLAELDLYTNKAHSFAGTYSTELGEEVPGGIGTEFSYIVVIEGNDTTEIGVAEAEVSITSLGEDEYRVEYSVLDEAGIMHCGVIERIEIRAYTESGSEYPIDNKQAIENTKAVFDPNSPVYNIQGMQVDRNTPGILIQKGYKFILVQ
ncbi:MAG: Ig-like domain-containing protein, partial [Paludibacteraceae bacterium]|nr:Ig-like domain-containing protein [Paludibacteraceae bacterium]